MDEQFSFGYWLKRQRLARDMRQSELAAQLGIAAITLRKIEADERRPSLQLVARLAELFALPDDERATLLRVARADLPPSADDWPAWLRARWQEVDDWVTAAETEPAAAGT